MIISHLVAVSNNNVIGKDNDLPWKLKKDLLHFKNYTIGKTVLMGRKTFESIGRPLPDRTNFIISNTLSNVEGAFIYKDLNSAINNVPDGQEVVIIGGGYLFRESINYFNKLVITLVDCVIEDGDIFYPEIDLRNWKLEKEDVIKKDHDNEYNFKVRVLTKNS
jgi:dihydrofolate reductase|tara:strand:- start:2732 stop:3220 length:489 start_codon:yes stop_codon:yes gene_type:complete